MHLSAYMLTPQPSQARDCFHQHLVLSLAAGLQTQRKPKVCHQDRMVPLPAFITICTGGFLGGLTKGFTGGLGSAIVMSLVWATASLFVDAGPISQVVATDALAHTLGVIPIFFVIKAWKKTDYRLVVPLFILQTSTTPLGALALALWSKQHIEFAMGCVLIVFIAMTVASQEPCDKEGGTSVQDITESYEADVEADEKQPLLQSRQDVVLHDENLQHLADLDTHIQHPRHSFSLCQDSGHISGNCDHQFTRSSFSTPQESHLSGPLLTDPTHESADSATPAVWAASGAVASCNGDGLQGSDLPVEPSPATAIPQLVDSQVDPQTDVQADLKVDLEADFQAHQKGHGSWAAREAYWGPAVAASDNSSPACQARHTHAAAADVPGHADLACTRQHSKATAATVAEVPAGTVDTELGSGVALQARSWASVILRQWRMLLMGAVVGAMSGLLYGLTGVMGPPLMYLYRKLNLPKETVRACNSMLGMLGTFPIPWRLIIYWHLGLFEKAALPLYVSTTVLALLGELIGLYFGAIMGQQAFRKALLVLMGLCCVLMFWGSTGLTDV